MSTVRIFRAFNLSARRLVVAEFLGQMGPPFGRGPFGLLW
jgi:hypothetical protein